MLTSNCPPAYLQNYLLGDHMTPFDPTASGMEVITGYLFFFSFWQILFFKDEIFRVFIRVSMRA